MDCVTIKSQVDTAQINMHKAAKIFGICKSMYLGKKHSDDIYRMLFKFPISIIPNEFIILKATLKIYVQYAGKCILSPFTPYALSEDWSVETVSWNNQPSIYKELIEETIHITRSNFYIFNITEFIKKWYENEIPNYGLIIKGKEEKNETCKQISTVFNSSLSPIVEITYTTKNPVQPIIPTRFIEEMENIDTNEFYSYSSIVNISLTKTITCHIENLGSKPVEILLQVSPDGIHFCNDSPTKKIIAPKNMVYVIPYSFAKYGRLAVKNVNSGETSKIRIWYQSQE